MDKKLHIIQHLYGEADAAAAQEALHDADLRVEYEQLREVKSQLDGRPRVAPDAVVIDRIMAHAGGGVAASPKGAREDRPPRTRRVRLRSLSAVSLTLAVVLAVGIGLSQLQFGAPADAARMAEEAQPAAPGEAEARARSAADAAEQEPAPMPATRQAPAAALAESAPALRDEAYEAAEDADLVLRAEADSAVLMASETLADPVAAAKALPDPEALPEWEEGDALVELHRRIELLQARSADDQWDEPAVMSLDVLPTHPDASSPVNRGLNTVGTGRSSGDQ